MKSTAWLEGCQAPCAGQQLGERTGGLPQWCSGRRRRVADLLHVGSGPLLDHLVDKAEIFGHLAKLDHASARTSLPRGRSSFPIAREIMFSCSIVALFFVPF